MEVEEVEEFENFSISKHSELEVEEELEHSLWLNGYCVLELGLAGKLEEAYSEVERLQEAESFLRPPSEVVDGILGDDGTSELTWLSDTKDMEEGETLQAIKKDLQWLANLTSRYSAEALGFEGMRASPLAVVRGGKADEEQEPQALDIPSCDYWMSLLIPAKLMVVYFLGPGYGRIELDPFDEESEPIMLETKPDMVLVFRTDALQSRLSSTDKDYTLCSWLSQPNTAGPRGWNTFNEAELAKNSSHKELGKWAVEHLEELMRQDVQGEMPEDTPKSWQRWMRATYFRHSNLPVAVVGSATHSPGCNSNEAFFKTLMNGVDYNVEVPFVRWNHADFYDPDPNCWMQSHVCTGGVCKTSVRHSTFVEGVDLFDNKFFQISASEATGMEPMQKHILETSYEALSQGGYTKKSLMNAFIAVFTGSTNPEAAYIPYPTGAGAGNCSQAITSNRTSFVFGCMGPSTSIDCEMASSAMAIQVGCAAVAPNNNWRQNTGGHSEASITGGVYLCVGGPFMWPRHHAHMNPAGRCFTWDDTAGGYVRGECCTSIIQKPYTVKLDGEWVVSGDPVLSTIVGYSMTTNGRAASITAPSVPAMQEALEGAMEIAGIGPLEMDAVECHGVGAQLEDAVEAAAIAARLRSMPGLADEPLHLGAVKSNAAAQCEAGAMTSFVKAMMAINFAANPGSLGLKQINRHIDIIEPLQFAVEALPYRDEWAFHGASARGWGGINTHIIQWFHVDGNEVRTERIETDRPAMTFWPGGGGHLEASARPIIDYHIVGSFNNWKPEAMKINEEGCWTHIVTMGMNRFETFQIWLDGDSNKVMHPGQRSAPSACTVRGPAELDQAMGLNWLIDGRVLPADPALPDIPGASTRDRGRVGDQYEVTLNIAGKYRAVSWRKVKEGADEESLKELQGKYYVTGSFNDWALSEMSSSEDFSLGLHTLRIGPLTEPRIEFQIVRNEAFDQRFHPPYSTIASTAWDELEVEGPDDAGHGKNWWIKGDKGDYFLIEFQRTLASGMDVKRIAWRRVV